MSADVITAAIAAVPSTIAAGAAVIAARRGKNNGEATQQVHEAVGKVQATADTVAHQTNGEMDAKIRRAVTDIFKQHKGEITDAVMAESVRHLLDAMLNGGDTPPSG